MSSFVLVPVSDAWAAITAKIPQMAVVTKEREEQECVCNGCVLLQLYGVCHWFSNGSLFAVGRITRAILRYLRPEYNIRYWQEGNTLRSGLTTDCNFGDYNNELSNTF